MTVRRNRRLPSLLTLAAALGVAGATALSRSGRASAPPGQYETFQRTSTCITDRMTMLTWQRTPTTSTSLQDAQTQCANLNEAEAFGWRLPSVNELETIVDDDPHPDSLTGAPKVAIDANAFPETDTSSPFWTSSLVSGSANYGWVVSFTDGSSAKLQTNYPALVRCVTAPRPPSPSCE